jgi:hypothetical protein
MLVMWVVTVRGEMPSAAPISLSVDPSISSSRISFSRGLSEGPR